MRERRSVRARYGRSDVSLQQIARGLGWFSIALGAAELLAPRDMARQLGMRGEETLIKAYGLREIGVGVGILLARNPAPWVWARVAGDALDLATLAGHAGPSNRHRGSVFGAIAAVAGVTALDWLCAGMLGPESRRMAKPLRDYSNRSGFPQGAGQARNVARESAVRPVSAL
jgi:hypothetical protein